MSKVNVRILFFGELADLTGQKEVNEEHDKTWPEFMENVILKYPLLKDKKYKVALNRRIVNNDSIELKSGDEIAFLPPFSGG